MDFERTGASGSSLPLRCFIIYRQPPWYSLWSVMGHLADERKVASPTAARIAPLAIDEILMRTDLAVNNGQPFYYQDDHEGSVTHLTNGTGGVIENYCYDVFGAPTINGNPVNPSSAFNNRFIFTGREYTNTFGIYEYRARAYHPGLGRFTGEDPKGFDAGDYNLFRYCGNDPEDIVDPSGLDADIHEGPDGYITINKRYVPAGTFTDTQWGQVIG